MEPDRLLVAGATGYIGSLLAKRLLEDGASVRCMARSPEKAADLSDAGCEVVEGDVLEPDSLEGVFDGVGVAYYLIHSMGRGSDGGDFAERDKDGARNFADAAKAAGVKRLIYLGGLGGEGKSKHLRSRHETAEVLAASGIPLTYFRAAAVLGSGSESFRTIVYLAKRLPVMVTPKWTQTRTQPIAIGDVLEFLAAAPRVEQSSGAEIEIGGPEVTTYGGLLDETARALGKRPPLRIPAPLLSPKLSSHWIGLVTPVDAGVAKPLIEGLSSETVVEDASGMELFGIDRTSIADALRAAVDDFNAGR